MLTYQIKILNWTKYMQTTSLVPNDPVMICLSRGSSLKFIKIYFQEAKV